MSTPPSSPPRGISAKHTEVDSELTRPTRCGGMRSKNTAPRIGLRKPEAKPPTTKTVKITGIGASTAITTKRGSPVTRKAIR